MPESGTARSRRKGWLVPTLCLAAAVLLLAACFALAPRGDGEAFGGTDDKATQTIEQAGGRQWFRPLFEPGSGEVESGLFALQAALAAGVFGYAVGRLHGRRLERAGAAASGAPAVPAATAPAPAAADTPPE